MSFVLCRSQETNITKIIIIIIMVVVLCHTPDRVLTVFKAIQQPENKHCPDPLIYASHFCNLLIVINSSANFIIYCILRRRFRYILCSLIRHPCDGRRLRRDPNMSPTSPEQTSLHSWPGSFQHRWTRRSTPQDNDRSSHVAINGRPSDSSTKRLSCDAERKRKLPSDTSMSDSADTGALVTFHIGP